MPATTDKCTCCNICMLQLYFLSHQGSESSTSEGINRVFEAAQQHARRNPAAIPVVLLDEVRCWEPQKETDALTPTPCIDSRQMQCITFSWTLLVLM